MDLGDQPDLGGLLRLLDLGGLLHLPDLGDLLLLLDLGGLLLLLHQSHLLHQLVPEFLGDLGGPLRLVGLQDRGYLALP